MAEPKPMASLTGGLLARKGLARPAMRSALQPAGQEAAEDLGWNDFGPQAKSPARIVPIAAPEARPTLTPEADVAPAPVPPVVRQQAEIAGRIGARVARSRRRAQADGRRAAFTLRLDADRHLALRLASAVAGRSAQQLVTEALDRLLAERPEIAALAAQIQSNQT